jgi:hypothetical protein
MARSVNWIIVLTAGWEPSENEKAQFVAEITEMKAQSSIQEFTFISQNYLRDKSVNYFEKADPASPVFATFASVASSVLQESQLVNYLRAEMPAILANSANYDIQWERFLHPTKKCEGLVLFIAVTEEVPQPVAGDGNFLSDKSQPRKMVQQIKGSIRGDKPEIVQRSKTLSPIPRKTMNIPLEIGRNAINFPDISKEKDREADNIRVASPLPPSAIEPDEKTERMSPLGAVKNEGDWDSFLQDLGTELGSEQPTGHKPQEVMRETPELPKQETVPEVSKETPSKTLVHRFPKLPSQITNEVPPAQPGIVMPPPPAQPGIVTPPPPAQPGIVMPPPPTPEAAKPQRKQGEFGEWSDFLNQLDGEVAPDKKKEGAPQASQEYLTNPVPKASGEQDWKNFLNEVETSAVQPATSNQSEEKKPNTPPGGEKFLVKEEPRSDSKIFQGRGLFLTPEELALEQALKKHESKKRVTPPGLAQAKMDDNTLMPTIRRSALGKPSLIEPLSHDTGTKPALTQTRMNESLKKGPSVSMPMTPPMSLKPVSTQGASNLNIRQAEVQENLDIASVSARSKEAGTAVASTSKNSKSKPRSHRWLAVAMVLLLLLAGGGYAYYYFYPEDCLILLEKTKSTLGIGQKQAAKTEDREQKFQHAWDTINHDRLMGYLEEVKIFLARSDVTQAAKEKAHAQRIEILDKYEKFLADKVEQLGVTNYQFVQAAQFVQNYAKITEFSTKCPSWQKTIQQKANDTAEQASVMAVQTIIAAGNFIKGVETFRTINQHQLPQLQVRLKELEGILLKHFVNKYRQESKYREGVRLLTQFLAQSNSETNISHATLRTTHHLLALIHYHILQLASQSQYVAAQQELKNYEQELSGRNDLAVKPSELVVHLKRFQEHIKEEKWVWEQLCRGIQQMTDSNKPYPLEYLAGRGSVEKVRGKVIASKDVLNTGKFQIPVAGADALVLYINLLTTQTQQKILKNFADNSQPLKLSYGHGFYLFTQGRIEDAKVEFSKAGFLQEFENKLEFCK